MGHSDLELAFGLAILLSTIIIEAIPITIVPITDSMGFIYFTMHFILRVTLQEHTNLYIKARKAY
jgi:hypothetical protein